MFSTTRNWLGFVLGMVIFFVIAAILMALSLVTQLAESCGRGTAAARASEAETLLRQPAVHERAPIVVPQPKRSPAERGYIQPRRLSVGASLPTRPGHVQKQQALRYFPGFLVWVVDTSDAEIGQWN